MNRVAATGKWRNPALSSMLRCAAVLAMLFATFDARAADTLPEALSKKLQTLAGPTSQDCGMILLHGDRAAAIACARAAAASGNAYRLAVQMQGSDSYTWQGAVRDGQGRQWTVFYDADISAGPAASPSLGLLLCAELSYADKGNEIIDCKPSVGQP